MTGSFVRLPSFVVAAALLFLSVDAAANDWVVLPVFGSQPDTGLQFGTAAFWEAGTAPDDPGANLFAIATEQRQVRGNASVRLPGRVADRSDYFLVSVNGALFPSTFYGYRSTYLDAGISYDETSGGAEVAWSYPLTSNWRGQIGLLYQREDIQFDQPDQPLLSNVAGTEGGDYAGFVLTLERDTRASSTWPLMGTYLNTSLTAAVHSSAGPFLVASQSVAGYRTVRSGWILAVGGQVQAATESTPFTRMPTLAGSQWLRGETDGRFRHQTTIAQQIELRRELTGRMAATGFLHQGQVGPSPDAWWESSWKQGGGVGLRYSISDEQRQNVRVDLGWVDGRRGFVISFGEAF